MGFCFDLHFTPIIASRLTMIFVDITMNMKVVSMLPILVLVITSLTKSVNVMLIAKKKKNDISLM